MKNILILLSLLFVFSCKDDAPEPAPTVIQIPEFTNIDFMMGSYSYTVSITNLSDANKTASASGSLTIANPTTNVYKMELDADGNKFTLSNLTETASGVVFDINDLSIEDDDGDIFIAKGVPTVSLGGLSYHGLYDKGTNKVTFSLKSDYNNSFYDYLNSLFEFTANHK